MKKIIAFGLLMHHFVWKLMKRRGQLVAYGEGKLRRLREGKYVFTEKKTAGIA